MSEELPTVVVGPDGALAPSGGCTQLLAREAAGRWAMVPEVGRLLVFDRLSTEVAEPDWRTEREVTLAGVFDNIGKLTAVLNLLHMSHWDGALQVASGDTRMELFFRKGVYLSGRSCAPQHRLGRILVAAGLIEQSQLDRCLGDSESDRRLGQTFVSRGWLTTTAVYDGLRRQAEEIFYSVLSLSEGSFFLVAPLNMTEVPAMLRLDVQHLLLDGMRRLDEQAQRDAQRDESELRRTVPVATADLPDDGILRVIAAYNDGLRRLFAGVDHGERKTLMAEMATYIADSVTFANVFAGLKVADNGSLPGSMLVANIEGVAKPQTTLQLALNELLFFVMFAAGDALDPEIEERVQAEVADALKKLPKPRST